MIQSIDFVLYLAMPATCILILCCRTTGKLGASADGGSILQQTMLKGIANQLAQASVCICVWDSCMDQFVIDCMHIHHSFRYVPGQRV